MPTMQKSASAGIRMGRISGDGIGNLTKSIRLPPRAPAKHISGMASGKGITAATARLGGPPTEIATRNGLFLLMALL